MKLLFAKIKMVCRKKQHNSNEGFIKWGETLIDPPKKLAGTEVMANGQNNRQVKYPERAKHTVAMAETIIFKINAVGLSVVGKILNRAITAIYPDAPPWPTLEYRIATPKIHAARTRTAVGLITSIVVFVRQSYLTSMSDYRLALYCCND